MTLAPGELFLVNSHGIDEAENSAEEQFGNERIRRNLAGAAALPPAEIVYRSTRHQGAAPRIERIDEIELGITPLIMIS